MTFEEWASLNDFKEVERLSADNHILHYVDIEGKTYEVDENLETCQISITKVIDR